MPIRPSKRGGILAIQITQRGVHTRLKQYPTDIHVTAHRCQHERCTTLSVTTVKRCATSKMQRYSRRNT